MGDDLWLALGPSTAAAPSATSMPIPTAAPVPAPAPAPTPVPAAPAQHPAVPTVGPAIALQVDRTASQLWKPAAVEFAAAIAAAPLAIPQPPVNRQMPPPATDVLSAAAAMPRGPVNAAAILTQHKEQVAGAVAANADAKTVVAPSSAAASASTALLSVVKRPQEEFGTVQQRTYSHDVRNLISQVDEYDPLNPKNVFTCVLSKYTSDNTGKGGMKLTLFYRHPPPMPKTGLPDPAFKARESDGRIAQRVRFPPMTPDIALMRRDGTYNKNAAPDAKLITNDPNKASALLVFSGHPPQLAVKSPDDPKGRDINFLKSIQFVRKCQLFMVAYVYKSGGAGLETDPTYRGLVKWMQQPEQQAALAGRMKMESDRWDLYRHQLTLGKMTEAALREEAERIHWHRHQDSEEVRRSRHELDLIFSKPKFITVVCENRTDPEMKVAVPNTEGLFIRAPLFFARTFVAQQRAYEESEKRLAKLAVKSKGKPRRTMTIQVVGTVGQKRKEPGAEAQVPGAPTNGTPAAATAERSKHLDTLMTLVPSDENSAVAAAFASATTLTNGESASAAAAAGGYIKAHVEKENAKAAKWMERRAIAMEKRDPEAMKLLEEEMKAIRFCTLTPPRVLFPRVAIANAADNRGQWQPREMTAEEVEQNINHNALIVVDGEIECYWGHDVHGTGVKLKLRDVIYHEECTNVRAASTGTNGLMQYTDEEVDMYRGRSFDIAKRVEVKSTATAGLLTAPDNSHPVVTEDTVTAAAASGSASPSKRPRVDGVAGASASAPSSGPIVMEVK